MSEILPLTMMRLDQKGIVHSIAGGRGMAARLSALGIRPGVKICKRSALLGHGPVIVTAGTGEVAVGHQIAARIMVKVDE
ncbi:MAG: FeoA domain-containing protein [Firmicutes bacterium]|nr:FeoA domain-containing protein [Bacillota bacterium]